MLKVNPVNDDSVGELLDKSFDYKAEEGSFRFLASDVNDDDTEVNCLIGYCVCTMNREKNEISLLKEFEGVKDDEAMIITARSVMNFMYRCEVKTVTMTDGHWAEKLGFRMSGGKYSLDLDEFYKSPCQYSK